MTPKKFKGPQSTTDPPQRKPRAPKQRPPGLSNAEWVADVKLKARQAAAPLPQELQTARMAMERNVAAAKMAMERPGLPPHDVPYLPGGMWGSQSSVASPTNFSPAAPTLFQESHGHNTPPLWRHSASPEYGDGDPHNDFNPNVALPHCPPPSGPSVFNADINVPYGGSPTYSRLPTLRRGPFPFVPSNGARSPHQLSGSNADARSVLGGMTGDACMDEIITIGSMASASCPGFFTQEETGAMDSQETGDDQEEGEAEADQEEGETEEEEPATSMVKGKKRKRKSGADTNCRVLPQLVEETPSTTAEEPAI